MVTRLLLALVLAGLSVGCGDKVLAPTAIAPATRIGVVENPTFPADEMNRVSATGLVADTIGNIPVTELNRLFQLAKANDVAGIQAWAKGYLAKGITDAVIGIVIKEQMEKAGYRCTDEPWWFFGVIPSSLWYTSFGCAIVESEAPQLPPAELIWNCIQKPIIIFQIRCNCAPRCCGWWNFPPHS